MLPNDSTIAVSVRTDGHSGVAVAPDADAEARWTAWRARGVAHDRAVRRKMTVIGGIAGIVATAAAIAYTLLRP